MTGCATSHFFSAAVRSTNVGALVGSACAQAQTAIAPAARQAAATRTINSRLRVHNALTGPSSLKTPCLRGQGVGQRLATAASGFPSSASHGTDSRSFFACPCPLLFTHHARLSARFIASGSPAIQSSPSGSPKMQHLPARVPLDEMKIRLLSHLHLEHSHRHPPFSLPAADADAVVLAWAIGNRTRGT